MRKSILNLILSIILCLTGYSQGSVLKGTVRDSIGKQDLASAVVYLKKATNSTLVRYTRVDSKGNFVIKDLSNGIFTMVVTYPGYVDWIDTVDIKSPSPVNVPVFLMTKVHLLEEVVVKQRISPIRIKGDTTEFVADSFHVRPDATVEDLLRVLPGMSVNAKGQITSNGQSVQNVLVDGEEFFGNDPTMATQNLNKRDIARVQVYDKKSDKAIITGIEDGVKQKTVNLILKDDAKKGYFGELSGGTDFSKYYQGKATISRFTSKQKMGALFVADRTGREGINFDEEKDFGTNSDSKQGIPETIQAAAMYNTKFGQFNNSTANNYGYYHLNLTGESYTSSKYVLPDTAYYSNQNSSNSTSAWQQTVNSKNEYKLDSFTTLTVNGRLRNGRSVNNSIISGESLAIDNTTLINTRNQRNSSTSDFTSGNADVFLKKIFDKKGSRFLTLSTSYLFNDRNTEGFLYNKTDYYSGGVVSGQDIVDQKKVNINEEKTVQALASYVTPISKKVSLNLNYTFNLTNTDQDIRSYEKKGGKYDSLDLLYSNHYLFTNSSHRGGFSTNYSNKKITLKTGLALQNIRLKQNNLYKDSTSIRNFVDFFPTVNMSWKYSKVGNLSLNYYGRTQQPTLAQLQPLFNNNDPLNIQIGNPGLKPAFYHNMDFQIEEYKQAAGRIIRAAASASIAENDFSSLSRVNGQGQRLNQTINVDGNYSYNAWVTYGRNFHWFNLSASLQPRITGSHYINYVNGEKNVTDVVSFLPTVYVSGNIESVLDIQTNYSYELRNSVSSVNTESPTNYHIHTIWLFGSYYMKNGWTLNTSYNYNIREKLSPLDANTNAMIWNVSIEKKFSSKSNISAIIRLNDILNQNIGFSRAISSTSTTENTYTTIQRYVLFSLRWKFNKNRNPN